MAITVTPVDDDTATVVNNAMTVNEGDLNTVLTTTELSATDTDSVDTALTYTVGNVTNGTLTINGSAWVAGSNDTFTQQDIIDGNILYSHDDSNTTSDSVSFSVGDGTNTLAAQTFNITVTAVDDDTATVVNNAMTVNEGDTNVVLSTNDLSATDTDSPDAALIYTVSNVSNGALTINGSLWALGTNDTFTQQDILDGNIVYSHNDSNTTSERFIFSITDGNNTLTNQAMRIMVTPVDDDTLPSALPSSNGENSTSGDNNDAPVDELNAPVNELGDAVEEETPPEEEIIHSADDDSSQVDELNSPAGGENSQQGNFVDLDSTKDFGPQEQSVSLEINSVNFGQTILAISNSIPEINSLDITLNTGEITLTEINDKDLLTLGFLEVGVITAISESSSTGFQLQSLEFSSKSLFDKTTIASVSGVSLTAGYIAWLLRSGAVVSSLMATMPLWNSYDPLPVVKLTRNGQSTAAKDASLEQKKGDIDNVFS